MLMSEQEANNYTLMEATLKLLQNRSATIMLKQIQADLYDPKEDKKNRISYDWLCKLHQGKLDEPNHPKVIQKLEKLNKYLVSKLNPTLT